MRCQPLAQSGNRSRAQQCPLLGAKRTLAYRALPCGFLGGHRRVVEPLVKVMRIFTEHDPTREA
jgi:hypothetical protein